MKTITNSAAILIALLFAAGCRPAAKAPDAPLAQEDLEAREDSLAYLRALEAQASIQPSVVPDMETQPIQAGNMDDAADDPAIWVHPSQPERSLVIGSNKKGGIVLYDLLGKELAYYPVGNINNVDVCTGVAIGGRSIDLVGGTNRSSQSIDLFAIDPDSLTLTPIGVRPFLADTALMDDVYGFCFYKHLPNGKHYVFANAKNGRLEQYEIVPAEGGNLDLQLVRSVQFDSQVEGMAADHELGYLYVGEEDRGVWKLSAAPDGGSERRLIAQSGASDNPAIRHDVEGLDIYYQAGGGGYLIVSSQGNFSYAVFDRKGDNAYLTSFKITASTHIDGVEETDGLALTHLPLGSRYPAGIMLVQDGFNTEDEQDLPQNFKLINWMKIEDILARAGIDTK